MLPTAGLRLQVTAAFELPVTVAVNCCVWPCPKLACAGLTLTTTGAAAGGGVLGAGGGVKISVAVALLELSATLVAFTVTVCCAEIDAGAV